jgi:cytochrome o ubiquinol oxidase operon protein cyoD
MTEPRRDDGDAAARELEERKDFRSYAWGIALALVLTLVAFALVHGAVVPGLPRLQRVSVIGALALVQMVVHFRCFLHIGWRERREDLLLILFSALLLVTMVAGTLWIMASLAMRMALPSMP